MKPLTDPATASQFDAEPIQEGQPKYKYPRDLKPRSRMPRKNWPNPENSSREPKPLDR